MLQAAGDAARLVSGLSPLFPTAAICAPAATCACAPGDNVALHRALSGARAGDAIVCSAGGHTGVGHFGELMALDARGRGVVGLLIDGAVRDSVAVTELGFPIFHVGLAAQASVKERARSVDEPVELCGVPVAPGDQIVADRDGVLVVPAAAWPEVEAAAQTLREREAGIRAELAKGRRLAELIALPADEG